MSEAFDYVSDATAEQSVDPHFQEACLSFFDSVTYV